MSRSIWSLPQPGFLSSPYDYRFRPQPDWQEDGAGAAAPLPPAQEVSFGRADEAGRSTIESLQEIIAVSGNMPVLIDSGFRRGTDIVKALCMGAKGVAVGRPYLWGLGAFGQPGVERVLDILRTELVVAMQQVGAPDLQHLVPSLVVKA